ncbi:hypothetical protein WT83_04685 [Burkholderia territorii]|uniref:Uncharacterized protein n=1 Tax=Burkholderia territorii TaxID=1503055 RepID=A0A108F471_9BURK|nr:hypothetical protein WT83_04685 [Burkholderia territorii]
MIRIKIVARAAMAAARRSDACAAIWRVASSERHRREVDRTAQLATGSRGAVHRQAPRELRTL